jgi:prolyl oligopeptidase
MKKMAFLMAVSSTLASFGQDQKSNSIKYPQTHKGETVDVYFDSKVSDPYRWLEDDKSAETGAWVKAQNTLTYDYLSQIPFRNTLKARLEKLWNYEKIGAPFKEGNNTYYYKNNGLQNQSVLYKKDGKGLETVFLDPNTFSKDGTSSLGGVDFSTDGSKVGYAISEGGSDWRKVIILDVATQKILEDTLVDIKFSGISWRGNEGFYYSSYDKPKGSELSAKTDQHKLYFHKLGTPQKQDQIIFGLDQKRRYVGGSVTEDGHYLVITASTSTYGNELYIQDLTKSNSPILLTILTAITVLSRTKAENYL